MLLGEDDWHMIRVTIWNENVQEHWADLAPAAPEAARAHMLEVAGEINKIHPAGIHGTLAAIFKGDADIQVRTATMDMPEHGLTEEVLEQTDVLIWWGHVAHDQVSDAVVRRVQERVLRGMGLVALHSAHMSKPLKRLLGTGMTLGWREGDYCHVWTVDPTHPIAEGVSQGFLLEPEEMYSEFFDIPKPDELIFLSWFRGGEVFRSGCTWHRGYGRIFYFQPGHETYQSFYDENVRRIIRNAVRWVAPARIVPPQDCPNIVNSPELLRR